MKSPFFINEVYGLGYWLKDYAWYPKSWPLFTYMDHGVGLSDRATPHEIENNAPLIFKFSPRTVALYKKASCKPVYTIVNPYIHYRKSRKINVAEEAKGTIFFVAHSTSEIDDLTDWEEYINQLKAIPKQFHPIDVCLHPTDMGKGLDRIFKQHGYNVFTAGDLASHRYTANFYDILRNYRYSMSNVLGSYCFYSVEMGIPFSFYGEDPKYFNRADINIEKGNYLSFHHFDAYKKAKKLFTGFHSVVSKEQAEFVNFELGVHDTISRGKACWLVYKALLLFALRKPRIFLNTLRGKYNGPAATSTTMLSTIKSKYLRPLVDATGKLFLRNRDAEYRLYKKRIIPRNELFRLKYARQPVTESQLFGKKVKVTDAFWYLHSLKELFEEETYKFESTNPAPRILDCGANIGLSAIYFKRLFPLSKITAFEPDHAIAGMMEHNLAAFGYSDVAIQKKAVWTENTTLKFNATGGLGGTIAEENADAAKAVEVPAIRLRDYLDERIGFLKIDIEGAEADVLKDCADKLHNVEHLFMEYHSAPGKPQELDVLLGILKQAGFRIYIKDAWNNLPYPFLYNHYQPFYDLQLNVFAYREK